MYRGENVMLENVTYDKLCDIVNTQEPIRGRYTEDYPWADRKYSPTKYFTAHYEKDDKGVNRIAMFDVFYGKENLLLSVFPMNIVEFNPHEKWGYSQGETQILKSLNATEGWMDYGFREGQTFYNEKRRGGFCYSRLFSKDYYTVIPIRKGIRYYMDTDKVVEGYEYDIVEKILNRKTTNKIKKENASMFKQVLPWLTSLSANDLLEIIQSDKFRDTSSKEYLQNKDNIHFALKAYQNYPNNRTYYFSDSFKRHLLKHYDKAIIHELRNFYDNAYKERVTPCENKFFAGSNHDIEIKLRGRI